METFGERLRRQRTERGLETAGVDGALGLPQGTVARFEADEVVPDIRTAEGLAELLGISMDELIGDTLVTQVDGQVGTYPGGGHVAGIIKTVDSNSPDACPHPASPSDKKENR